MNYKSTYDSVKETILRRVKNEGRFTVPSIAEETGLSTTTVAKQLSVLRDEIPIDEIELEESGRKGRKAVIYGIRADSHYFLGVDIKNVGLAIGMMDFTGNIVKKTVDYSYSFENSHENMDLICSKISSFLEDLGPEDRAKVSGVGFNIGGRVDSMRGTSASIFNFEETQDTPLADLLSEVIGLPVVIENDTKAMTYAEYIAYGMQWSDVLYVNIGWGLGMGIIIGGRMYYGANGYSGEMGHMRVYENNILCHCGKKGCLETEVSMMAISRKLQERILKGETSILSQKVRLGEKIDSRDILDAAEKEDQLCIELISETGKELGKQLAGIINLFNPGCIIIGGQLAKASPFYFQQQVALSVKQHSLKLMNRGLPILLTKLGDDAGITGACLLARDRLFLHSDNPLR
jgi:transcriptional regulator of PTS gene